jgi:undecaprenyl diphosphate synthase
MTQSDEALAPTPEELLAQVDLARLPRHVAVIMDGNGRWARAKGLPRVEGHRASMQSIRECVEACNDIGVKFLTLYAFSTENWSRPPDEVAALMVLIDHSVRAQVPELHEKGVQVKHLGRRDGLPESLLNTLDEAARKTGANPGMVLQLAINYGGRQEIADAARAFAHEVASGTASADDLTEEAIAARLYRPDVPDPDLLVRTGGEMRVSNYLLWEIAYAEIYVTPTLWPDFRKRHVYEALLEYQGRQRRFGKVDHVA